MNVKKNDQVLDASPKAWVIPSYICSLLPSKIVFHDKSFCMINFSLWQTVGLTWKISRREWAPYEYSTTCFFQTLLDIRTTYSLAKYQHTEVICSDIYTQETLWALLNYRYAPLSVKVSQSAMQPILNISFRQSVFKLLLFYYYYFFFSLSFVANFSLL